MLELSFIPYYSFSLTKSINITISWNFWSSLEVGVGIVGIKREVGDESVVCTRKAGNFPPGIKKQKKRKQSF